MRRVVDPNLQKPADEVVERKCERAQPMRPKHRGGYAHAASHQVSEKRPQDFEYCPGRSDHGDAQIPCQARKARQQPGVKFSRANIHGPYSRSRQASDVPQRPHVEQQMRQIRVQEDRRQQPPQLPIDRVDAEIRTPAQQLLQIERANAPGR